MLCFCFLFGVLVGIFITVLTHLLFHSSSRFPLSFVMMFENISKGQSNLRTFYVNEEKAMAFTLSQDYLTQVTVRGFRRDGSEAPLEDVVFSVDTDPNDPLGPVVELLPEGSVCTITPVRVGTVQFQVTADARIGEGTKHLTGIATIDVVPGEAVSLNIEFSEPTPRP